MRCKVITLLIQAVVISTSTGSVVKLLCRGGVQASPGLTRTSSAQVDYLLRWFNDIGVVGFLLLRQMELFVDIPFWDLCASDVT